MIMMIIIIIIKDISFSLTAGYWVVESEYFLPFNEGI